MPESYSSSALAERPVEKKNPDVSVVIVCHNQARYLRDAIDSVTAQTVDSLEIIVVDDGSTDQTPAIAQACPGIRYVRQENRGLASARNTGIRESAGDYLVFLDADDRLLPHAVESGLNHFREYPDTGFVFGTYRNIFDDGSAAPTDAASIPDHDEYRHLLQGNFIGMHGAVLYSREVIEAAGGFNEALRACEDYELYLRIARQWRIRGHRALVAEYRQHDHNMSKDRTLMLRSVLSVLAAERKQTQDRGHRQALRHGVRVWRDYYGPLLWEQWMAAPGPRALAKIFLLWPGGVSKRLARSLVRRASAAVRLPFRFGGFRRTSPVSRRFGFDRGQPIDRHYIETFLAGHAGHVRGRVLEVGDDAYSRRFGGARVVAQDILHVVPGHPGVTIVADLSDAPQVPSSRFDCVILTQTMHYIFDLDAAVRTLHRILKPGGALLVTLPGISAICRDQEDRDSDCWRFTASSARRLFARHFGDANTSVNTYGNVLTAVAFLEGLAVQDLKPEELDHCDRDYPVTIAVAAFKPEERG
jgi:glycosyltransferase involved in cell wall biosynthesis